MQEKVGRYQLLRKIATGGMAELYVAKQAGVEGFEKLVAVKRLLPKVAQDPLIVQLFLNEARLAARLTHPNILQILDLGTADGHYFIAMEYLHGEDLATLMRTCQTIDRKLPVQLALRIVSQVCEGLAYAHAKKDVMGKALNVVHSDVSLQNIFITFEGAVKLVDFGVARAASAFKKDAHNPISGKLGYMSPEQSRGEALDPRSDIFSLSLVFWELVTSRRYYGKVPPEQVLRNLQDVPARPPRAVNPEVPAEIEAIIVKGLSKDPSQRFQTAFDLHSAIEQATQRLGLATTNFAMASAMQRLFSEKLVSIKRIVEAEEIGRGLNEELFDDLQINTEDFEDGGTLPTRAEPLPLQGGRGEALPMQPALRTGTIQAPRRWGRVVLLGVAALMAAAAIVLLLIPEIRNGMADGLGLNTEGNAKPAGSVGRILLEAPILTLVKVDGHDLGPTPIQDREVSAGAHILNARAPETGCESKQTLIVKPGEQTRMRLDLRKGMLVVKSKAGSTILLAGEVLGVSPFTKELCPGSYPITVQGKTQVSDQTQTVDITPNQRNVLTLDPK